MCLSMVDILLHNPRNSAQSLFLVACLWEPGIFRVLAVLNSSTMKRVGTLRSYRLVLGEQRHPDLQCLRAIVDVPIRYERESSAHSFLGKGLLKNAGQPRWKVVTPRRNIVVCAKKKQVSKKASGANVSGIGFGEKRTQVNGGQKRLKQKVGTAVCF